ncbi:hypothetical protein WJU16_03075 [Chitinophaga pollutisoli]|uniref:FixH protein n=1 Tax=Chitinophaga pollutisoli TaxID=3133966 RepID=A0ABZ2YR99_9BACT
MGWTFIVTIHINPFPSNTLNKENQKITLSAMNGNPTPQPTRRKMLTMLLFIMTPINIFCILYTGFNIFSPTLPIQDLIGAQKGYYKPEEIIKVEQEAINFPKTNTVLSYFKVDTVFAGLENKEYYASTIRLGNIHPSQPIVVTVIYKRSFLDFDPLVASFEVPPNAWTMGWTPKHRIFDFSSTRLIPRWK